MSVCYRAQANPVFGGILLSAAALLSLFFTSGCNRCGPPPSAALPPGAIWDEGGERCDTTDAMEACAGLYDRAEKSVNRGSISLPSIDMKNGTIAGGSIVLGKEESRKYQALQSIDLEMVTKAKERCATARVDYQCVRFFPPESNPVIVASERFTAQTKDAETLTKLLNSLNSVSEESKPTIIEQIRELLKQDAEEANANKNEKLPSDGPTSQQTPLESGTQSPPSRPGGDLELPSAPQMQALEIKIDGIVVRMDALEKSLGSFAPKDSTDTALKDILRKVHGTSACFHESLKRMTGVAERRGALARSLGFPEASTNFANILEPVLQIEFQQANYANCQVVPSPNAREIASAIGAHFATQPDTKITVLGYHDEQPIVTCPKLTQLDIATQRATNLAAVIHTSSGNKLIPTSRGIENNFLRVGCRALSPEDAAKCHAQNRRFQIRIESNSMTYKAPPVCATKP